MSEEEIEELKDFTIDLTDIDELALGLEVCSKKSNMVIQEFADIIIQLQQKNQQLNNILTELEETIKNKIKGFKEDKDYFIDEKDMYELDNLIQKLKEEYK